MASAAMTSCIVAAPKAALRPIDSIAEIDNYLSSLFVCVFV